MSTPPRQLPATFASHVVSWNLTRRCNLRCEHCYISAGRLSKSEARGELSTDECLRVVDQICEVNPEALLILTGGEPLLRPDVFEIARYAHERGLWVVVGTNGVKLSERLCQRMLDAGVRGVSLSLDALDAATHDRFRAVKGAWENTVNGARLLTRLEMPFIVQTTVGEHNRGDLRAIADLAADLGARVFNVYFLVPTGRGSYLSNISPDDYEQTLAELVELQRAFAGKMLVNSKCAPHYQRVLYQQDPQSPFLKSYAAGAGGCPAGTHYVGIRPDGDVTPCPYLPVYGGNLREKSFREIWEGSEVFERIRARSSLGGRCGSCELNRMCGGCRARAYGASGDYMAEDPWCSHEPGSLSSEPIEFEQSTTYGAAVAQQIRWSDAATERLGHIPSFVRGMVVARVEAYARERGLAEITPELMHEVRRQTVGDRIGRVPSFVRRLIGHGD